MYMHARHIIRSEVIFRVIRFLYDFIHAGRDKIAARSIQYLADISSQLGFFYGV